MEFLIGKHRGVKTFSYHTVRYVTLNCTHTVRTKFYCIYYYGMFYAIIIVIIIIKIILVSLISASHMWGKDSKF